ncbi:MAG: hypothetical protein GY720_23735 [bacterium]|nr:hypothetical protein [bacterium]
MRLQTGALVAAALTLGLAAAACGAAEGSGRIVTETRDLSGFDSVAVSDGLVVHLSVGSGPSSSIVVRYDDNVIDNIITRLEGSTLIVELVGDNNLTGNLERAIDVSVPRLDILRASSGSIVVAEGLIGTYTIRATSGASIDATKLLALQVDIEALGGSMVSLHASSAAIGAASGGATVSIAGKPPRISIDTSDGASVDS